MTRPPSLGCQGLGDFDFLWQLGVPGLLTAVPEVWVDGGLTQGAPPRALSSEVLAWKVALFPSWHASVKFCGRLEIGALSLLFLMTAGGVPAASCLCVLAAARALL